MAERYNNLLERLSSTPPWEPANETVSMKAHSIGSSLMKLYQRLCSSLSPTWQSPLGRKFGRRWSRRSTHGFKFPPKLSLWSRVLWACFTTRVSCSLSINVTPSEAAYLTFLHIGWMTWKTIRNCVGDSQVRKSAPCGSHCWIDSKTSLSKLHTKYMEYHKLSTARITFTFLPTRSFSLYETKDPASSMRNSNWIVS